MTPVVQRLAATALALVAVAVGAILVGGGDDPYEFRVMLDNAGGLREGTSVRVGDIDAGKVSDVSLTSDDKIAVSVDLDAEQGPVGRDARVSIRSLNLLGQRFLSLDKGDVDQPARAGFTVPADRVDVSTDLDQVLNTLDATTRARLGILLNEAGLALTGRTEDVRLLLEELPSTLPEITTLLERITADNRSLGRIADDGDRFIARLNSERDDLVELFDSAHATAQTLATKRREVEASLREAPSMLRATQALLADVRTTSGPLGPAARELVKTAAPLEKTLGRLEPFAKAIDPALDAARDAGPSLTELATGATPVLRTAATTAAKLDRFSTTAKPATATLDDSVSNIIAILDNWSRALQYRDALSHTFRGEPSMTTNTVESLVERLMNGQESTRGPRKKPAPSRAAPAPSTGGEAPAADPAPEKSAPTPPRILEDLTKPVEDTVAAITDGLLGRGPGKAPAPQGGGNRPQSDPTLLDFLLKP